MKRPLTLPLMAVASTVTLYAFWAAEELVHEFSAGLTWLDVGTLFALGLIGGVAIGGMVRLQRPGQMGEG